jgi:hypothetical protein
MDRNRAIQSFTDAELEELTLTRVHVRFTQQARIRSLIIREPQAILDWDIFLGQLNQYVLPPQYLRYLQDVLR